MQGNRANPGPRLAGSRTHAEHPSSEVGAEEWGQAGSESEIEVDYRQATAEELAATEPETYDVVTCLEMLEHVPDPAQVIRSCAELVKPGGHVFFSTINRNFKSFAFAIFGAEY
ncbi:MAG: methyltransferase domain-containing protein, partial [Nitrospirae bacterium]|nr:methyltransferase domain-containing protein [Nitrospirota bacterium]